MKLCSKQSHSENLTFPRQRFSTEIDKFFIAFSKDKIIHKTSSPFQTHLELINYGATFGRDTHSQHIRIYIKHQASVELINHRDTFFL